MKKKIVLISIILLISTLFFIAPVHADTNTTNETNQETDITSDNAIIADISDQVNLVDETWDEDNKTYTATINADESTNVGLVEADGDPNTYNAQEYSIEEGETQISFNLNEQNDIFIYHGFENRAYRENPHGLSLIIEFDRSTVWSDHPITATTAVLGVFFTSIYRYKRKNYFDENGILSLFTGEYRRTNKKEDPKIETRWFSFSIPFYTSVRLLFSKIIYNPPAIVIILAIATIIDLLTGIFSTAIIQGGARAQLATIVLLGGLPAYWIISGNILNRFPTDDKQPILERNNADDYIDVLGASPDAIQDIPTKGGEKIPTVQIKDTQSEAYVINELDTSNNQMIISPEEIYDPLEVMEQPTYSKLNHYYLKDRIDKANEIILQRPANREKLEQHAISEAQRIMDEQHSISDTSTETILNETSNIEQNKPDIKTMEPDDLENNNKDDNQED